MPEPTFDEIVAFIDAIDTQITTLVTSAATGVYQDGQVRVDKAKMLAELRATREMYQKMLSRAFVYENITSVADEFTKGGIDVSEPVGADL